MSRVRISNSDFAVPVMSACGIVKTEIDVY